MNINFEFSWLIRVYSSNVMYCLIVVIFLCCYSSCMEFFDHNIWCLKFLSFFLGRFCISNSRGNRVKVCKTHSRHYIRCSDNPTPAHLPASLREQTSRCRPVPRPGTLLSPEHHPTAHKRWSGNSVHPGPRPAVHPGRSRRPFLNRSLNLSFRSLSFST